MRNTFSVIPKCVWMPIASCARDETLHAASTWSILSVCQVSSLHHNSNPPISALQHQNLAKITLLCSVLHADAALCARSDSRSHRWEAGMPSLDPPPSQNPKEYMEVLPRPPTSFPQLRDKCAICSFPERLRRARHAYACSRMPWHATDESIPKSCLGSQYQGS